MPLQRFVFSRGHCDIGVQKLKLQITISSRFLAVFQSQQTIKQPAVIRMFATTDANEKPVSDSMLVQE